MSVVAKPGVDLPAALSELSLAAALMDRSTVLIPIPTRSVSGILLGGPCILAGLQVREALGTAQSGAFNTDTDVDSSSGNVANAAAVATLPGVAAQTTFITGFEVTATGATAALTVAVTVVGVLGGTKAYAFTFPAGAALAATPLVVEFSRPIPASAVNTAIVVTLPAGGVGNANAAVTAHGFQRVVTVANQASTMSADLLSGQDANGELVLPISLAAGAVQVLQMGRDGPFCSRGLFLNMLGGSLRGAVWVKV